MLLQISLKIYDEGGVKVGQEFKDLWRHRIEAWVWEAPAQGGQHARDFQLPPEQRPLLDDNPANDLVFDAQLIHEVNFSLDNDVDIVMEFSADIPDHGVLPTIALEKACMGHEFKVVEQFRDKSIVELRGVRARGVPWDARVLRHCSWWGIRAALLNFKVCLEEERRSAFTCQGLGCTQGLRSEITSFGEKWKWLKKSSRKFLWFLLILSVYTMSMLLLASASPDVSGDFLFYTICVYSLR